jgi:uncharacterized protein (DUF4415 family)
VRITYDPSKRADTIKNRTKGMKSNRGLRVKATRIGRSPKAPQPPKRLLKTGAWVDPDEAPELTKEYFERADLYLGDKLIRRGRPPSANPKQALKLRIDADVVEYFRATGPGWQTRINDALRRVAKRKRQA